MSNEIPKPDGINRSLTLRECTMEMVHLAYHHRKNAEYALIYSQIALNLLQVNNNLKHT